MFGLEAPPQYRLNRAPLAQAIIQLHFPMQARLSSLDGIAPIQNELNTEYPSLRSEQLAGVEFEVNARGIQNSQAVANNVYRFTADDGHEICFTPNAVHLAVGAAYSGRSDFTARLSRLVAVLRNVVGISRIEKMGVRYISLATTPEPDQETWNDWFRPEVTGWATSQAILSTAELHSVIQQSSILSRPTGELNLFPADILAIIRHGLIPAGSIMPEVPSISVSERSFIMDVDLICTGAIPVEPQHVANCFTALHGQIDRFFYWSLTESGKNHFGFEELP